MKLNYITFMVRDIEKSIKFYEEAIGLKLVRRFNPGMGEIAFLANEENETMLEFVQFENVENVSVKGMVMSYKAVETLDVIRKKMIEKGYKPSEIIDEKPKPAHFTVCDPDGVVVEISI